MKIEITTNEIIDKVEIQRKEEIIMTLKIDSEEQLKIDKWLYEILGNGKDIDTMEFPILKYTYCASDGLGYMFKVNELLTKTELDLTDINKF